MSISVNSRRNLVHAETYRDKPDVPRLNVATQRLLVDSEQTRCLLDRQAHAFSECAFKQLGNLDHNVTGPRSAKFRVDRFFARSQVAVARSAGWAGLQWLILGPIATMALPRIGGYEKRLQGERAQEGIGRRSIQAQEYV